MCKHQSKQDLQISLHETNQEGNNKKKKYMLLQLEEDASQRRWPSQQSGDEEEDGFRGSLCKNWKPESAVGSCLLDTTRLHNLIHVNAEMKIQTHANQ